MKSAVIQSLFKKKKYFILDLDGTLYQGSKVFPYTLPFLNQLRATGRTPIFLTNNSSKSTQEYFAKLKKLQFTKNIKEIYTSGLATIEYLKSKNIQKIFLLAVPSVEKEFKKSGFTIIKTSLKDTPKKSQPQAVVLTFDKTFTYDKFTKAYEYIVAGIPFYASHPDDHLPIEDSKFHPDIGTLIAAFQTATNKLPIVIGKPQKTIYQQLQAHLKCQKSQMVMVGDRLYTDIKGAKDYGITSVLVLSGETTPAMLKKSKIKPDFTLKNISEITKSL